MPNLAAFISPHGFGHAARTCAILEALARQIPGLITHIYTRTPEWFFKDSLGGNFHYHAILSDVGLVQTSGFTENLPVTLRTLDSYVPFPEHQLHDLSQEILTNHCQLVLCDISPLGIEVARRAALPSILVENFTWDWIYSGYTQEEPEFQRFIDLLSPVFLSAIHHIQAQPFCTEWRQPNLSVPPISRPNRQSRQVIRHQLGFSSNEKVILITLGGIRGKLDFLDHLPEYPDIRYIIPGASKHYSKFRNQVHLPFHHQIFHPDLVAASDAIIGKAGYSTIAEAYHAGVPYGFIPRINFLESPILEDFIHKNMHGVCFDEKDFFNGHWQPTLNRLLATPARPSHLPNGAPIAAAYIANLLS
jgi:hypothetical protein